MPAEEYFNVVEELFKEAKSTQMESIKKVSKMIVETIQSNGMIFCFGTGHSHMIAEEVFGRAGGLMEVRPILEPELMVHENDTKATYMERLTGLAQIYLKNTPIEKGDLLIIASNSGINSVPIEMALIAKKMGVKTVAVTSVKHSKATPSRHVSGKKLFEIVDVVLDNCGEPGDAAITIEGVPSKVGATSTIMGCLLVNAVMVEAIAELVKSGQTPSVMFSSNNRDKDSALYNAKVRMEFSKKLSEREARLEKRSWEGLAY
jgi:uncharacterized phosphosugar-binding protein